MDGGCQKARYTSGVPLNGVIHTGMDLGTIRSRLSAQLLGQIYGLHPPNKKYGKSFAGKIWFVGARLMFRATQMYFWRSQMTIKITTVKTATGYLIQAFADGKLVSVAQADAGDVQRRRGRFIEDWTETPGVSAVVAEAIPTGQVECECVDCTACDGEGSFIAFGDDDPSVCARCIGTGMDKQDCACHGDVDGLPIPNGVCCREYAEHSRHARDCGNYDADVPTIAEALQW